MDPNNDFERVSKQTVYETPNDNNDEQIISYLMQSYPVRALARRLQVDWARDPRKGPRVLMSLRVDFEPMG